MTLTKWRTACKNALTDKDLASHPLFAKDAERSFAKIVPEFFKQQIDFSDPKDPLLLQVLPQNEELKNAEGFSKDSVADLDSYAAQGVIHKYKHRVLLVTTGACAINCRYCFRRHFPYSQNFAAKNNWEEAIDYIQKQTDVHEVILSGGDPLMLPTKSLEALTTELEKIKHLTTLRIHSRIPVVAPKRFTKNLINWLNQINLKKVLVIHSNHANELSSELKPLFTKLQSLKITLLNQSVLLKDVNDSTETLKQLSLKLFDLGVLPYYLNLLDRTQGTHHFEVEESLAVELVKSLGEQLPGYLVPKLVRDIPNKMGKTTII